VSEAGRDTLVPLFLVSLSALGFEIALTRYFAVAGWSEYGYWVISITMAGFALSGVVLAMARDAVGRHSAALTAALPATLILAAGLGFHFTATNPFNPLQLQNRVTWTTQLWNVASYYAALLPFFFLAGTFVGLSFIRNSRRIGRTYGYDLTGAGVGAVLVMGLMFLVRPFALVPVLLLPLAGAGVLVARRSWPVAAATIAALVAAEALLFVGAQPHVSEYKPIYAPLHTPGAEVVAERLSPRGEYQLLDDFTERLDTDISNDAGMLGVPGPPRTFGLYRDGIRIAALARPGKRDVRYAHAALGGFPYEIMPHARALLVGSSGGFRPAEVLSLDAAQVDVIEPDPVIASALRHGLGPSPALAPDSRVRLVAEVPLAAARSGRRYDVIDVASDFLDASEANATSFTSDAVEADLRALHREGVLSLPVSIRDFPVYALRVLATARAALLKTGFADPARHVVIYRSAWNARVLISPSPWDAGRIAALRRFCDDRSFDVSYHPGIDITKARQDIYNDLPAISFASGEQIADGPDDSIADEASAVLAGRDTVSSATFSLAPATLDRPFFYAALRLSRLRTLLARLEVLPQPEIGALVNLAVLAQAAIIALIVLAVPLATSRRMGGRGGVLRTAIYFPALGLGFLFIEIYLIEEASLLLNDRTSGFALVLAVMLIFSGLGSMMGRFRAEPRRAVAFAVLIVAGWCLAAVALLQPLVLATLAWAWAVRAILLIGVIAPVAIALGLPFPLGLSQMGDGSGLPWGWALNGAFSVLATPLAALLSRDAGYAAVLLSAGCLYAVALLTFPVARRRTQWHDLQARSPVAD
jgi:hypothetical protein